MALGISRRGGYTNPTLRNRTLRVLDFHDWVSSWSHLVMALFMAFAGLVLFRLTHQHSWRHRSSVAFFATAAVILYSTSGLYHGIKYDSIQDKRTWEILDRTAIFILIFGSNVPLLVYLLPRPRRNLLLFIMASFAIIGSALLWMSPNYILLVICYLGIGFFGMVPLRTYYRAIGWRGLCWVFLMAFFYSFGAVCDAVRWPVFVPGLLGYHELFHVLDMAGTLAHVVLVMRYVIPAADRHEAELHPTFPVDLQMKVRHNSNSHLAVVPPV
jgi:hemolysin III